MSGSAHSMQSHPSLPPSSSTLELFANVVILGHSLFMLF